MTTTALVAQVRYNMDNLNILVTGANGQLGRCLQDTAKSELGRSYHFLFTDVEELDICQKDKIDQIVVEHNIDIIVNAAAYTAVDKAEEEVEAAYRLNRDAVGNLAEVCKDRDIYLVHISTDYVFSGEACHPYAVDSEINPQSVYGKSKAAGEERIKSSGCNSTIIRTSWLYSEYGHNFVKTMLRLGEERKKVSVVCDQVGGPTYAGDLAKAIFKAIERNHKSQGVQTYHFANEGSISWFDFTHAIMELGGIDCDVRAIFTSEYPAKAIRPSYSVFDLSKTKQEIIAEIPYWRKSLSLVINKLR